ncbi:MAG TPA: hypothetical protein VLV83_00585 [Acidobacteriota bacterium]|nr:hypothetical protein [Acidobacteriota bacterium]
MRLEGKAVLLTGGQVVEAKVTEPGQVRGTGIEGGTISHLKPGDAVVIPAGTPHQFTEVEGPFLYFVVKPIAAQ